MKRQPDWRPSELLVEALRIWRLMKLGISVQLEAHPRELMDAVLVIADELQGPARRSA